MSPCALCLSPEDSEHPPRCRGKSLQTFSSRFHIYSSHGFEIKPQHARTWVDRSARPVHHGEFRCACGIRTVGEIGGRSTSETAFLRL